MKDVNIQDHFNQKVKNKDVVYKLIAHDVVYKHYNPEKKLPTETLKNYVNHYMDKALFEQPPELDEYDY